MSDKAADFTLDVLIDPVALAHFGRTADEHARMAELLCDLYAVHYGPRADAIRVAHEHGLEPTERCDWMTALREMLGDAIELLLDEVRSPAEASPC